MNDAPPSQHIGRVLGGQYRVEALLGYGGMGAVYRGVQLSVQRPVAIKLMGSGHNDPEQTFQRFRREAEATARLAHPNTVRVFDFGVTESHELFMVMELLEGCDLAARLKQGPLPLSEALAIVRQVLAALSEAHALGIVHRDLKPGNVFLSHVHGGESFVKVMDFGIAGISPGHEAQKLTVTGAVMGTPAYMSPEQAQGKHVDARSDLYSIGVMLFEMLTGKPPFEADTLVSMLLAHVTQPPKRLVEAGVTIPELDAVQALLDRLLAKQAAERPGSAPEVAQLIDGLLGGARAHAWPPARAPESAAADTAALPLQTGPSTPLQWDRTRERPARARGVWITVCVASLAGLGAGAAYWVIRTPPSTSQVVTAGPTGPARAAAPQLPAAEPATTSPQPAAAAPAHSAAMSGEPARAQPSTARAAPEAPEETRAGHRRHQPHKSARIAREESERAEPEAPPHLEPSAGERPVPASPRSDLNRAPPYPSMAAAKKALDGGKINASAYQAAINLLKARRNQRVALERENLQKGQISPQEYEWRLGRIDAEYRGE